VAHNPTLSAASKNLALDAALNVLNSGFVEIYDGTQPASPDVAVTTQNKLAKLALSSTAFGAASGGTKTANAITSAAALLTGTASWYRLVKSDDTTGVQDGTVGTSGCDATVPTTAFSSGVTVSCSSLVISM